MDLTSGFTIGRVRGIEIRVHWSWLLIFALLAWSLTVGFFPELMEESTDGEHLAAGLIATGLFFGSVLLHELSHSFVAQSFGMTVPSITLFVFGGVSSIEAEARSPGEEFKIAIAGPLMSWILGLLFAAIWFVLRGNEFSAVPGYLAWINFALGAFNLLPGFPLDGGRVLRAIVWARVKSQLRATRIAAAGGTTIAYAMIGIGVVWVLFLNLGGLWYVLIGLFLKSASDSALVQTRIEHALRDVHVRDAMAEPPPPVEPSMTLQQLVDERILRRAERALFVGQDGRVIGLITTTDLSNTPREQWGSTRVDQAMVPADKVITIEPDEEITEAMRLMQQHDIHQLPVLESGKLLGLLTRGDLLRQLELRTNFARERE